MISVELLFHIKLGNCYHIHMYKIVLLKLHIDLFITEGQNKSVFIYSMCFELVVALTLGSPNLLRDNLGC